MSGVDFARQEGLNPNTFAWWRSELGREAAGPPLSLVPVKVAPSSRRCQRPHPAHPR